MENKRNEAVGQISCHLAEEHLGKCESFLSPHICITTIKSPITIPAGTHCHDSYEFIIPVTDMPYIVAGSDYYDGTRNKLYAINSKQIHGAASEIRDVRFTTINISRDFLNGLGEKLYGCSNVIFSSRACDPGNRLGFLIRSYIEELSTGEEGHNLYVEGLSNQLVLTLFRLTENNLPLEKNNPQQPYKDEITKAVEYLKETFNREYSLEVLAGIVNLSPFHLIRVFKSQTGQTPYDYLLNLRIGKARELLSSGSFPVSEICTLCGFNSLSHFSTIFKKRVGTAPSDFRRSLKSR